LQERHQTGVGSLKSFEIDKFAVFPFLYLWKFQK